jgi:ammonia channel protein AmtB
MVAAYIERSTVTGMAFSLLIFALTIQNFFIFRNFWQNISLNNPNGSANFTGSFNLINYVNIGNSLRSSYTFGSASLLDAVGASLAMYAGYTAVIGRIGLTEIFFLTWIGTFIYEINSQILWRLYIPDSGYPSRAFAYGGMLGLVSSIVLNKRDKTVNNPNFRSSYKIMALAFLGIIFVWCSFPVLVVNIDIVGMAGQVNIWLALAASVLGCYTASSFSYRKFCVHDMVFGSITVSFMLFREQSLLVLQLT